VRKSAVLSGIGITQRLLEERCRAVSVVNIEAGRVVAFVKLKDGRAVSVIKIIHSAPIRIIDRILLPSFVTCASAFPPSKVSRAVERLRGGSAQARQEGPPLPSSPSHRPVWVRAMRG
jgi:hypothetical protein